MSGDKNSKIINKIVITCVVVLGIVAFRYFELGQYLSLEYIKASQEKFQALYLENRILVITSYMGIYIAVTALSLPGAAVLTLAVHVDHLAEIACVELPAQRVNPSNGELQWFIDRAAAAESGFPSTMV